MAVGVDVAAFTVGQRVRVHPATDAFMSGKKFGTVVKLGRLYVHVKMDFSGRVLRFRPRDVLQDVE